MDIRSAIETRRQIAQRGLDPATQEAFGQHFTPSVTGDLLTGMLRLDAVSGTVRVLDPGAGTGSLTAAVVHRLRTERPELSVHVTAVEVDPDLAPHLAESLAECERYGQVETELVQGDFLTASDSRMRGPFDLVIANPPYGKLARKSEERKSSARRSVDTRTATPRSGPTVCKPWQMAGKR
ncbi:N-6 DNA methylase [Nocardiopsis oceani]